MRLWSLCGLLFCGCPSSAGSGTPTLAGTIALSIDPDQPLVRGQTVLLKVTLQAKANVAGDGWLWIALEPGLSAPEPTVVHAALPVGGSLMAPLTVTVPDDDIARRLSLSARFDAPDGRSAALARTLEANSGGRLHAEPTDAVGALDLVLDTSGRLRHGTDVTITLTATARLAHPRFELALVLPPEMTLTSGALSVAAAPVMPGDSRSLTAQVHIADSAQAAIAVTGWGRYGLPTDADHQGGAAATIEDAP